MYVVLSIERIFISIIGPKTKNAIIALAGKIPLNDKAKKASTLAQIETMNARAIIVRIASTGWLATDSKILRGIMVCISPASTLPPISAGRSEVNSF